MLLPIEVRLQYNIKIFQNFNWSEKEQTNIYLYNHPYARKTYSELDLIDLSLFNAPIWSDAYKRHYYSKEQYTARNWWNQYIIEFNKPGWWNLITGWETVGLNKVIEKYGPSFFKQKYVIQARKTKLNYNLWMGQKTVKSLHTLDFPPIGQFKKKIIFLRLSALFRFNKALAGYASLPFGVKRLRLLYPLVCYLITGLKSIERWVRLEEKAIVRFNWINHNIKPKNKSGQFQSRFFAQFFIKYLRNKWALDNTHYLHTIDFRITILIQPYTQIIADLITVFYAQQMSLISARPTQRWYLRDIKRFNQWFWVLSQRGAIVSWQLSTMGIISFNTKGRILDTRRVFSRQNISGKSILPKSKYLTKYKVLPLYSQTQLTTKWGSTNLRVVYYVNPLYHTNSGIILQTKRFYRRKFWNNVIAYRFAQQTELNAAYSLQNSHYHQLPQIVGNSIFWRQNRNKNVILKPGVRLWNPVTHVVFPDKFLRRQNRFSSKVQIIFRSLNFNKIKKDFYRIKPLKTFDIFTNYPTPVNKPAQTTRLFQLPVNFNKWHSFLRGQKNKYSLDGQNALKGSQKVSISRQRRWGFAYFKNYKWYASSLISVELSKIYLPWKFFQYR